MQNMSDLAKLFWTLQSYKGGATSDSGVSGVPASRRGEEMSKTWPLFVKSNEWRALILFGEDSSSMLLQYTI